MSEKFFKLSEEEWSKVLPGTLFVEGDDVMIQYIFIVLKNDGEKVSTSMIGHRWFDGSVNLFQTHAMTQTKEMKFFTGHQVVNCKKIWTDQVEMKTILTMKKHLKDDLEDVVDMIDDLTKFVQVR